MTNLSSKKVALLTGASSGIGAVYADRLAARGYDLILVARRADRFKNIYVKVSKEHTRKAESIVADLTKEQDLTWIESILATNKYVGSLVNNVGIARLASADLKVETLMTTEHMVDEALAGLDQGETTTSTSVADVSLCDKYEAARSALFVGTQA